MCPRSAAKPAGRHDGFTVALKGGQRALDRGWTRRTEQQAASLEETAAALDEITATVRRTADGHALVFEMLERLEALVERVNRLAEIWRSQAPHLRYAPAPLRAR
jgi:hypothetical protein